jgi:ribosomal protein S18 acetylase RimI-like enzyme
VSELEVRPMLAYDLDEVATVSAAAFDHDIGDPASAEQWRDRLAYPLESDPAGAFVACRGGRIIGAASALVRERLWVLSLLTVEPGVQSAGAGRALLERTLGYADGTDSGLIISSNDGRAMRLYAGAGFAVLPALKSEGKPDRSRFPAPDPRVRDGDDGDLVQLAEISREVRGAPHTAEVAYALSREGRLLLIEARGFAVVLPGWAVWLMVARDEDSARSLLWAALEAVGESERAYLNWITGDQQWAIDVAVRAGLRLTAYGALCTRGDPGPLAPFIPSGPFG